MCYLIFEWWLRPSALLCRTNVIHITLSMSLIVSLVRPKLEYITNSFTRKTKARIQQLRLGPTYKIKNTPTWDGPAQSSQVHMQQIPQYQLSYWNATNTQLANFREKANKNTHHLSLQTHTSPCSHIPYKFTYSIWSKNKTIFTQLFLQTNTNN